MSRNYAPRKIKQELNHALKELEGIGFLEPMTAAERYSKTRQGTWNIRFVAELPPPAETPPAETKPPEPEPTGLEKELVERGVTRSVAADLVRDFPEERIRRQIEVVDWLRETKPKRIKNLGAYPAEAIRKDFAPSAGFKGQAERAAAEATARRGRNGRSGPGRRKPARAVEAQVQAYWAEQPPDEQKRLEAAALDQADPAARAAYEAATGPARRLLQVGLRDVHLRRLLGLPAAD